MLVTLKRKSCFLVLVFALLLVACAQEGDDLYLDSNVTNNNIVDVEHTAVERQTIGNCWIYANAGWAESMHKTATGVDFDLSQSYWTYMHWFEQLTTSTESTLEEIGTGGNWYEFRNIVRNFGLMKETDFVPADSDDERSFAQSTALDRLNAALKEGGELATKEDRGDPEKVRAVMDEAWGLSEEVISALDTVFGRTLENTFKGGEELTGTVIIPASQFEVAYTSNNGLAAETKTLENALDEWRSVSYSDWSGKDVLRRVQRALHDRAPVMISWFVDFNALEEDTTSDLYGSFNMDTLKGKGRPGRQGGHLTVLEDYQAVVKIPGETQTQTVENKVEKDEFIHILPQDAEAGAPFVEVAENVVVTVKMTGDGDADLYVRKDKAPTINKDELEEGEVGYDCRPYDSGSKEQCTVVGPAKVFIGVSGYRASNFQLEIETVETVEKLLEAGTTLDPEKEDEKALLDVALAPSTDIVFLRIKNSWGANRFGLAMAPAPEKGYHDLYMNYLGGKVADEKDCEKGFDDESCRMNKTPLSSFILPPGY